MPPYRFHVRTTAEADNQLLKLLVQNPTLRNAITRASNDMDRVLEMGPPNQGRLRPILGFPTAREVVIHPLLVTFYYSLNAAKPHKVDPIV